MADSKSIEIRYGSQVPEEHHLKIAKFIKGLGYDLDGMGVASGWKSKTFSPKIQQGSLGGAYRNRRKK